jgi:hypothetical protein
VEAELAQQVLIQLDYLAVAVEVLAVLMAVLEEQVFMAHLEELPPLT